MSTSKFARFINKFTCGDLAGPARDVVWVLSSQTCPEVLTTLAEKQIQSVPVWDEDTKSFLGMVDVLDLLTLLVVMNSAKDFADLLATRPVSWDEFSQVEVDMFSRQTIKEVCNASRRNPWCPVHFSVPLHSLMDMFGNDVNLHRVGIVNDAGDVTGIVTQSQVIRFLAEKVVSFSGVTDQPISSWYTPSGKVVSVPSTDTTLKAFQTLLSNNVSGVAVVDSTGAIINTLSGSDIKVSLGKNIFSDLNLPLPEFLTKSNEFFKRHQEPIVATMSETLESVLNKLNDNHIHRLFVVDAANRPIGVLSLCDLISHLNVTFSE